MGFEKIFGPNFIVPTPPIGDNSNQTASTAFVNSAITGFSSPLTNSLSSDHALTNSSSYFDGPTVAQGTSGVWFASGTITLFCSSATTRFDVKLWDGVTVMDSLQVVNGQAGFQTPVSLSGFIASPAGNIRISARDTLSVAGLMLFNASGNSKDCTITAIRIG
jgi:hypothetical protein